MKNFFKAISGKKALVTVLIIAIISSVLEIVTAFRQGTFVDLKSMSSVYAMITIWAVTLIDKDKKNAAIECAVE